MFFGANSKQKGGHKSIIVFIVVTVKDVCFGKYKL